MPPDAATVPAADPTPAAVQQAVSRQPLLVAGPRMAMGEKQAVKAGEVVKLPYITIGEWDFRGSYGPVNVTSSDLDGIVRNFDQDARRQDLPLLLDEEHAELPDGADVKSYVGPGAIGWIQKLERDPVEPMIWAHVELNRLGEQVYHDDRYRGTSPEVILDWTDPESDQSWGKTAAGLALTTMPRMKSLAVHGKMAAGEHARVLAFSEVRLQAAELRPAGADNPPLPGGAEAPLTDKQQQAENMTLDYAFPELERLPLTTPAGVKGAMARFMTVEAAEEIRDHAWQKIRTAAYRFGIEAPESWKQLNAAECRRWLLAEGDGEPMDTDPALCVFQPRPDGFQGCCPGFTRGPDDGDGDVDVCVFYKTCNGYMPVSSPDSPSMDWMMSMRENTAKVRATLRNPEIPVIALSDTPKGGNPMTEPTETDPGATAPAAAPAAAPAPAPVAAAPAPASATATERTSAAEFAETKNLLAAERTKSKDLARQLEASEAKADGLRDALRKRDARDSMLKLTERLDGLVNTGRITPAVRDIYTEQIADFAENPNTETVLKGLEAMPANSAVDLREHSSGQEAPKGQTDTQRLDIATKSYMSENNMKMNAENYRKALLHVSGNGYKG